MAAPAPQPPPCGHQTGAQRHLLTEGEPTTCRQRGALLPYPCWTPTPLSRPQCRSGKSWPQILPHSWTLLQGPLRATTAGARCSGTRQAWAAHARPGQCKAITARPSSEWTSPRAATRHWERHGRQAPGACGRSGRAPASPRGGQDSFSEQHPQGLLSRRTPQ